jgi:serine protease Do
MRTKVFFRTAFVLSLAFLMGGVATHLWSADAAQPETVLTPEKQEAVAAVRQFSDGFAAVAEMVVPSVVTISSEKLVEPAQNPMSQFQNDPFFQRFFGRQMPQQRPFKQRGLGSGVIVDADGYILTNNHVVRGADELTVMLSDGRRLSATVVGTDARTDLAVLKVDATDLPAMPFGNSENVRIGEWVIAVGSPFSENLQHTVTAGIVSALGRSGMNLNEYEDFIQTDAAINPGNSGGALVNLDGELIGINSAIASRTGGSNGIGFSIPSNLAMEVMNDLITDGHVTRGWLGVGIQDVNASLAEAMGLEEAGGILITSVLEDGPAAKAGLKQGDVIVKFDGEPVKTTSELRFAVARSDPGTRTDVVVIRDGRQKTVDVVLSVREDDQPQQVEDTAHEDDLGLSVDAITPELAQRLELQDTEGLVVTAVAPASPAEEAGIQVGDIVRQVNRRNVTTPRAYAEAIQDTPEGRPVLFMMERGGNTFFLALRGEN